MAKKKLWIEGDALKVLLALDGLQPGDLIKIGLSGERVRTFIFHSQDGDPNVPINVLRANRSIAQRKAFLASGSDWDHCFSRDSIVALHRPSNGQHS